jgi:glutaredoxin
MKLVIYSLIGCPFSKKAEKILKAYKINHHLIKVTQKNKQKFKKELNIETFPQIYLQQTEKAKNILIGGCSDLENYIDILHLIKENDMSISKLIIFNRLLNKSNKPKRLNKF